MEDRPNWVVGVVGEFGDAGQNQSDTPSKNSSLKACGIASLSIPFRRPSKTTHPHSEANGEQSIRRVLHKPSQKPCHGRHVDPAVVFDAERSNERNSEC